MKPEGGGRGKAIFEGNRKPFLIASMKDAQTAPFKTYLKPSVTNFPVAAVVKLRVGNVTQIYGFQMSVRTTKCAEASRLENLVDSLGCTNHSKFNLVWVTPPNINFCFPPLPVELKDRVLQWVLKLPLRVPSALKRGILASDITFSELDMREGEIDKIRNKDS